MKQTGAGLLPLLILIVPAVSEPLIDDVPPFPSTELLVARPGVEPVKLMWLGISSEALPLRISRVAVICEAVIGPLNDEAPDTVTSRMVVEP